MATSTNIKHVTEKECTPISHKIKTRNWFLANRCILRVLLGLHDTLLKTTGVPLSVLVRLGRSGFKGACEERPFLLHPAAVIWHHLLLKGAEAYREGIPAPGHNPRQCMSAICMACCRNHHGGERMTPLLGLRQRDTVSFGLYSG